MPVGAAESPVLAADAVVVCDDAAPPLVVLCTPQQPTWSHRCRIPLCLSPTGGTRDYSSLKYPLSPIDTRQHSAESNKTQLSHHIVRAIQGQSQKWLANLHCFPQAIGKPELSI